MKFETHQQLQTGQQFRLAPRIIQAMEILQLSLPALEEKIEQEIESNIALELIEPDIEDDEQSNETSEESEETSFDDYDFNDEPIKKATASQERDRKLDAMANIRARQESLSELLLHQWTFAEVEESVLALGRVIINYIDADGFITITDCELLNSINKDFETSVDNKMLLEIIVALQKWLDPPGIAARSLQQSLLIQVDTYKNDDPEGWEDVHVIIDNHLEDILQNRLPKIASATSLGLERVKAAIDKMHELTLSPGRLLATDRVLPVIPDAVIEFDELQNRYIVGIKEGNIPPIRVSKEYVSLAKDKNADEETTNFIQRNLNAARWIIEAVSQRKSTLQRVIQTVADRQRDFLDNGDAYLRPLPMIEVADLLGIHVATVSRAVSDKWIQTPRGIFRLRRFFSGGTGSQSDGDMSWEAVKTRLQKIVDDEDKNKPLSDEGLAKKLREQGIEIARRTVVKYRQQLGIPAARLRKQF